MEPRCCINCKREKVCRYSGPMCATCYSKIRNLDYQKYQRVRNAVWIRTIDGLYSKGRAEAKRRRISWLLSKEEFRELRSRQCLYCDGPLPTVGVGLDRIDNTKSVGYVIHNVVPCCGPCNWLRNSTLTVSETKAAVMEVKRHRAEVLEKYHEHDIHVDARRLAIFGEINTDAAAKFIKNFNELESINAHAPVVIDMMSEGGFWRDAMAIFDRIKHARCEVTVIGYGIVASAASIILQSASRRVLMPDTVVMIHDGEDGFHGDPKSLEAWARQSKKDRFRMYQIYADASNSVVEFWEQKCKSDYILTAQEAVAIGLADQLYEVPAK